MPTTHLTEAEYPYLELSQKLKGFWMSLSEEQRKKVGAEVGILIVFHGHSQGLMSIMRNTVASIVPHAETDFDQIMGIYTGCAPEIQQTAISQLTDYFTSRNR